jgi:3-hydroxyacyl-[acyl-carrier-protein] dehydratase
MSDLETLPEPEKTTLDILEIMAILPHRYPFLLIDRVTSMVRKTQIVALKNVTMNEPFFQGHFPDYPVMPAVLMVEAMAQAGGALLLTEIPDRAEKIMFFTGIDEAKFRRPVTPGDQLRIQVDVINWRTRAVKMKGAITVDNKPICEAIITCMLVPRPGKAGAAENAGA